jgi:hypothetical protein
MVVGGCTFMARSPDQYRDDTSNLLSTKSAELNACYDNVVKTEPAAAGKVTVVFTVETKTGKITNVAADPARTTAPPSLVSCVVTAINGLVLNPPDQRTGNATFEYDFAQPVAAAQAPAAIQAPVAPQVPAAAHAPSAPQAPAAPKSPAAPKAPPAPPAH